MSEIHQLPQQVVNQIAAGEVVERPASVLKEILENALDAGATAIDITLLEGGVELIEVRDNGKGIAAEDLTAAFARYATSKISSIEDLQQIATYGFRGEALSSIGAVSTTTIISNRNGEAVQITATNDELSEITPASRGQGTTIRVERLFETLPARKKFLKTADTEYKYCLDVINYFALLNGSKHFTVTHNGKTVYTFPPSEVELFPVERVATVFRVSKEDILTISHQEYGIAVNGVLMHPKTYSHQSKFQVVYVNNRPIEDKGIYRAMQQGISGYAPEAFKASGIISLSIPADQVDINVHPRKREVKFLNPFRIYSAVTNAVSSALQLHIAAPTRQISQSYEASTVSDTSSAYQPSSPITKHQTTWERKEQQAYDRLRGGSQSYFFAQDTPQWNVPSQQEQSSTAHIPEYVLEQSRLHLAEASIIPILGRYIIVAFLDEIWVIDQHAAAERVRFEQFRKAYLDGLVLTQQSLLTPIVVPLSETHRIMAMQHIDIFTRLGISVTSNENGLAVTALPTALQHADIAALIADTVAEMVDHEMILSEPSIGQYATERDLSLVVATMACHNSVRMNQRITALEAQSIVKDLLACEIPYACPHGRRVVWRLSQEEVDKQFMRT